MSDSVKWWAPRVVAAVLAVEVVAMIVISLPWHLPGSSGSDTALDFTAAEIARQNAFRHALLPWSTTSWLLSVAVPLVIGFSPLGRRLYDALHLKRLWYVSVPLLVFGLGLLTSLITVPTDVMAERVTRRYGLSVQDWSLWTRDRIVNWALMSLALAVIALVLIAFARKWKQSWWLPAASAAAVLVLGVSFAYPVLVEPRFNQFSSMPAGALRDDFMKLAADDGVPVKDVLVADASKRTTALNAYVSGFGSTRRLVVYDTLLKDTPPAQVRLVVAHELGHASEDDVLHGTLIGVLGAALGVVLLQLLLGTRMADPRRTAMLLALIVAATTVSAPVQNFVSRRIESRADFHSLQLTKDPRNFVAMQHDLAVTNISGLDPSWWRVWLFATHPTPPERIAMGRAWASEHGLTVPPQR
ncbi:M48 family metalloprotease [Kribbella sp. NPDC051952]|uniref:M48 family metalloprotease n=1 Tax=Kribbella sp. NPDC051952 TaxID=3154851 RepID=UPI00342D1C9A